MASSTSNSDRRVLYGCVIGFCLAIACLAFAERLVRQGGHVPNVQDGFHEWAKVRQDLDREPGQDAIALLGASRMQWNISRETLSQAFGGVPVYQLAIQGRMAKASLLDIAKNSDFSGLVIVSGHSHEFLHISQRNSQQALADFYHKEWNWARRAEVSISQALDSRLALLGLTGDPQKLIRSALKDGQIGGKPSSIRRDQHREVFMDADAGDMKYESDQAFKHFTRILNLVEPPELEHWRETYVSEVADAVESIQDRGGRVVFVALPMGEAMANLHDAAYPRVEYWDVLAANVGSPTIHFEDVPAFRAVPLPDGAHIDFRDKKEFTQILAAEIQKVLTRNGSSD